MNEGAGQLVVFDQPMRFEHAAEEEPVQQLLAGEGQVGQRAGLVAEGEAVGQQQAPAFQVGQKALVERGLLLLVVEFVNAARFEVLGRQQFPQLVAAREQLVQPEREGRGVFIDADEVELGEVGEQNPGDGPLHFGLGADAVIADVTEHLLAVRVVEAAVGAISRLFASTKIRGRSAFSR